MPNAMYTLYIPKFKGSESETYENGYTRMWPLPQAIKEYLSCCDDIDALIVAPGFLSTTPNTTLRFLDSLNELCCRDPLPGIDVGVLRGVNGFRSISVDQPAASSSAQGTQSLKIIRMHEEEYSNFCNVASPQKPNYAWSTMAPLQQAENKNKSYNSASPDHSKMIFFIDGGLPKANNDNTYSIENYEKWKKNLSVKAMVFGSSNFSFNTYFGAFDKGEADILMFLADSCGKKYRRRIKDRIKTIMEGQNREVARSDAEGGNNTNENNLAPGSMILSRSVLMYPHSPESFFKNALYDLLERSLLFTQ